MGKAMKPRDGTPTESSLEPVRVVSKGDNFRRTVRDWLTSDRNALVIEPDQGSLKRSAGTNSNHSHEITLAEVAAQLYEERRLRDACFNQVDIFGEPAWDILLDVAFAEAKGERLPISKVCIGSCVPVSTAMRWINILQARNLVYKVGDNGDPLETFVRLTEQGHDKTRTYLARVGILRQGSSAP